MIAKPDRPMRYGWKKDGAICSYYRLTLATLTATPAFGGRHKWAWAVTSHEGGEGDEFLHGWAKSEQQAQLAAEQAFRQLLCDHMVVVSGIAAEVPK